jgi:hypothetical protein
MITTFSSRRTTPYLRDYRIVVTTDCVASQDAADSERALHPMRLVLKADVLSSGQIDFDALRRRDDARS